MKETGFVAEVHDGYALVRIAKKSACGENCASCRGGCVPGERTLAAKNPLYAKCGDRVLLELDSSRVISAAFLAYILPLAVFIAVYLVCMGFIVSEWIKIALSMLGAGCVFLAVHLLEKRNKEKYMPDITAIIKYDQKEEQ